MGPFHFPIRDLTDSLAAQTPPKYTSSLPYEPKLKVSTQEAVLDLFEKSQYVLVTDHPHLRDEDLLIPMLGEIKRRGITLQVTQRNMQSQLVQSAKKFGIQVIPLADRAKAEPRAQAISKTRGKSLVLLPVEEVARESSPEKTTRAWMQEKGMGAAGVVIESQAHADLLPVLAKAQLQAECIAEYDRRDRPLEESVDACSLLDQKVPDPLAYRYNAWRYYPSATGRHLTETQAYPSAAMAGLTYFDYTPDRNPQNQWIPYASAFDSVILASGVKTAPNPYFGILADELSAKKVAVTPFLLVAAYKKAADNRLKKRPPNSR